MKSFGENVEYLNLYCMVENFNLKAKLKLHKDIVNHQRPLVAKV